MGLELDVLNAPESPYPNLELLFSPRKPDLFLVILHLDGCITRKHYYTVQRPLCPTDSTSFYIFYFYTSLIIFCQNNSSTFLIFPCIKGHPYFKTPSIQVLECAL